MHRNSAPSWAHTVQINPFQHMAQKSLLPAQTPPLKSNTPFDSPPHSPHKHTIPDFPLSSTTTTTTFSTAMPDDLADDLQSMSFGSSGRSGSETISSMSTSSTTTTTAHSLSSRHNGLVLSDVRFVRRLGSGDIGSVYLAELKYPGADKKHVLAAKVMDRKDLEGRNKEGRAKAEREILEMLDHPFLPRLFGCAENERWSCLLTEFCPGGDLHVLRQRQRGKRFPENAVRFYASEVVVALEYLHMLRVVYRDLKPENVVVRSDGHIMLTDFDLSLKCDDSTSTAQVISDKNSPRATHQQEYALSASAPTPFAAASCILPSCMVPAMSCFRPRRKHNKKKKSKPGHCRTELEFVVEPVDARSMSFVGTHEYLAPEIISGEGHGSAVDWWTLGVFVFELLYGFTPFRGGDNELTLANIVARALEFPKEPAISPSTKDFITGLLVKDPARRMGSATGATSIKRHPFFGGVNWALLRCTTPPHIPPPFEIPPSKAGSSSREDLSDDDSSPGTPVEYY